MAKDWIVMVKTPDGDVDEVFIPTAKNANDAQFLAEQEMKDSSRYPIGTVVVEVYSSTDGTLNRESF